MSTTGKRKSQTADLPRPQTTNALADEVLKSLRRILRKTAEHSRQLGREAGLTVPQVLCLRAIGEAPRGEELTVAQIAAAIQLSSATVSRILDRLEAGALVVRERGSHDRRRVALKLTPAGRRRLRQLPTPLHEQFLDRLQALPQTRQQRLLDCLNEIVAMMGASDLDAAPMLTPDADVKPST